MTQNLWEELDDWQCLATSLTKHPTAIGETVPLLPTCAGMCDALLASMGRIWCETPLCLSTGMPPILWWAPFLPSIQIMLLVLHNNLCGTVPNSDLELTGIVGHLDILANATDM